MPELEPDGQELAHLHVKATARITARTGMEMEALTAVAVAALTVYDMCKAIDKTMQIGRVRLVSKKGGKSGPGSIRRGEVTPRRPERKANDVDHRAEASPTHTRAPSAGPPRPGP